MKKTFLFLVFCAYISNLMAQKESYDLISFIPPQGWKKEQKETLILYTIIDQQKRTWCQVGIVKSTISKGTINMDFDSEWQELIVKNYNPSEAAVANEPEESGEWKIKVGSAGFVFNNENAYAILSTMSGYNRCASIVITSNIPDYMKDIESLLGSVELITPEPVQLMPIDGANPTVITSPGKFAFTTTNFDNGWVSVVKEDWVEVTKQGIKVLIHYPNKVVDDYSPDLLEGLKEAWDVLVAPRYSSAKNFEFKLVIRV